MLPVSIRAWRDSERRENTRACEKKKKRERETESQDPPKDAFQGTPLNPIIPHVSFTMHSVEKTAYFISVVVPIVKQCFEAERLARCACNCSPGYK